MVTRTSERAPFAAAAIVVAATLFVTRAGLAAPPARVMYTAALAQEQAVRGRLSGPTLPSDALTAIRRVIAAYESIVKRYPSSGYSDNALWQAGKLSLDAFALFNEVHDRDAGVRLLQRLVDGYPSSRLVKQVPEQLARAGEKGERRGEAGSVPTPSLLRPYSVPTPSPGSRTESGRIATIKDIRRTLVDDAVRVTIELDQEVPFHDERIANPDRVFLDLPLTRATAALADQTLRFQGDGDLVTQIRIGRHPNSTTRVVLDAMGVGGYSVYPLYEPYRLVIDCVRPAPSALVAKSAAPAPVPAQRLPSLLEAHAIAAGWQRTAPATIPRHGVLIAEAHDLDAGRPTPARQPLLGGRAVVAGVAPLPSGGSKTIGSTEQPVATAGAAAAGASLGAAVPLSAGASLSTAVPIGAATLDGISTGATVGAPPPRSSTKTGAPGAPSAPLPSRNSTGGFSMARQLGLGVSRIVIDPGHGGHDPGAQARGVSEAELVLDVALRLEKILRQAPGVEVILTRRADEFIALQERTAIANREGADLFLSIHANASHNPVARGVETYFLNFASNLSAAAVAARENAASGQAMGALPDYVKAIALNNKLEESRDLATAVQHAMIEGLRPANKIVKDLGVKQAPFLVLIGAAMPSVLAEISFVTNPQEAKLLKSGAYRQRIAEALNGALRKYQSSLTTVTTADHQE